MRETPSPVASNCKILLPRETARTARATDSPLPAHRPYATRKRTTRCLAALAGGVTMSTPTKPQAGTKDMRDGGRAA